MERGEEFIYGLHLPPGFRFHPSDEELIVHYLLNKVKLRTIPSKVIGEIELYNFNPWELPKKALFGKDEWFFFSPRDRKYPNGSRPKRSAGSGFWKATGKDKPIFASSGLRKIGVKKALAFFTGHPTNSVKTNWTMSEYRLPESSSRASNIKGSMRLDDWVLCRVRQKGNMSKNKSKIQENPKNKPTSGNLPTTQELPSSYMITKANTGIISDHMFKDFQLMASILAGRDLPPLIETISTGLFQETKNDNTGTVYENGAFCEENVPFMFNEEIINNQDIFSGDMSTSDDSYDGFATDHLDVVMNIMEDGPFE